VLLLTSALFIKVYDLFIFYAYLFVLGIMKPPPNAVAKNVEMLNEPPIDLLTATVPLSQSNEASEVEKQMSLIDELAKTPPTVLLVDNEVTGSAESAEKSLSLIEVFPSIPSKALLDVDNNQVKVSTS
jgi:hypothetical protein